MKILLFFMLVFCLSGISSQTMNKYGHFIDTGEEAIPCTFDVTKERCRYGSFEFRGNTVYKCKTGYLSLDGGYENTSASVYVYSVCPETMCLDGKLQFRGMSKKMIVRFTGVNERSFFLT